MKPELIIALDVPSHTAIPNIVQALPSNVRWYKVGLELFTADGAEAIRILKENNKSIFLDLKLHDIPRTVARAVRAAAGQGVKMLTVHATGGSDMLRAAADAVAELGDEAPLLLAVTTLTSLSQDDIEEIGITRPVKQQTLAMGQLAVNAGIQGLVCSPLEAAEFRAALGDDTLLVTPGVRLEGGDVGDQKRVATPEMAVEAGANFLVVGRPILGATDPAAAAADFLNRIAR